MYACILYGSLVVKSQKVIGGGQAVETHYRVWIVRYEGWPPDVWHNIPAGAIAVEPAEQGTMSRRQARRYIEAFNRTVQVSRQKIWAVALPVDIRYIGDPQPGEALSRA
jgi:hypothetical protein